MIYDCSQAKLTIGQGVFKTTRGGTNTLSRGKYATRLNDRGG